MNAGNIVKEKYLGSPDAKDTKTSERLMEIYDSHVLRAKKHRPINLIIYVLIVLSRGNKNPLLLEVLSTLCQYKGEQFSQNQEHLFAIFCQNDALLKFMLSDLRIQRKKGQARLISSMEDRDIVLDECFISGKIKEGSLDSNRDNQTAGSPDS